MSLQACLFHHRTWLFASYNSPSTPEPGQGWGKWNKKLLNTSSYRLLPYFLGKKIQRNLIYVKTIANNRGIKLNSFQNGVHINLKPLSENSCKFFATPLLRSTFFKIGHIGAIYSWLRQYVPKWQPVKVKL